ncbi:2-phospho-L-lactate guanylyltransferase [Modestobacter sp. VKM Ac-2980]|uniref:2-phospho-L-lactate guanylyltransferase n=1 Tax=unclassified Modestobacter TaxID=2643866 RepID=UPI003FA5A8F2
MSRAAGWFVVVPLKALDRAKSRLCDLPLHHRRGLVIAMARDVRDAVLACPDVEGLVVVSGDPRWYSLLGVPRVRFVADRPADSLNGALRRGAAACGAEGSPYGIAALPADLPALRPEEITRALVRAVGMPTAFVPDAQGEGTTLFAARSYSEFWPHFGIRSRTRHVRSGAQEILLPQLTGLRQDVDTLDDLDCARALGLGPHTDAFMTTLTTTRPEAPPSHMPTTDTGRGSSRATEVARARALDTCSQEAAGKPPQRTHWEDA